MQDRLCPSPAKKKLNYIENRPRDISRCIKSHLNISSFDIIVVSCCTFDMFLFFGFFRWCWNSKHICSSGFFEFINFNFYATTKSWQAHQKIRLDELAWKKWVSNVFMETFIELSRKPFQNLLLWRLLVFAEFWLKYVALPLAVKNPSSPRLRRTSFVHPPTESKGGVINTECGIININ